MMIFGNALAHRLEWASMVEYNDGCRRGHMSVRTNTTTNSRFITAIPSHLKTVTITHSNPQRIRVGIPPACSELPSVIVAECSAA